MANIESVGRNSFSAADLAAAIPKPGRTREAGVEAGAVVAADSNQQAKSERPFTARPVTEAAIPDLEKSKVGEADASAGRPGISRASELAPQTEPGPSPNADGGGEARLGQTREQQIRAFINAESRPAPGQNVSLLA